MFHVKQPVSPFSLLFHVEQASIFMRKYFIFFAFRTENELFCCSNTDRKAKTIEIVGTLC